MIVGGYNANRHRKSNEIYYCVSNDINNKNNSENQSIWRLSLIELPFLISACQCIITDKKNKNAKLIILGGKNQNYRETHAYLEYNLCDIIGYHTFYRFIIDMKQVYSHMFFFLFFFVLF